MTTPTKQRVLLIGPPVSERAQPVFNDVKTKFDVVIIRPVQGKRAEAIQWIKNEVAAHGGFVACLVFFSGLFPILPIDPELLDPLVATGLKLVGGPGAGYDKAPIEYLTQNNVLYCNTPLSVAEPTASHAMILILTTLRKTVAADAQVRRGDWAAGKITPEKRLMGVSQVGLRLGILGMGSIGRILAKYMIALGMKVTYYNRKKLPTELEGGATYVNSMEELLKTSDVLSVHVPLSSATRHLIGAKEIALMPDNSFIINTARGAVIDESSLVEALQSGKLAGAGLDVFEEEPKVPEVLFGMDNVVLTSHFACNLPSVLDDFEIEHFDNLTSWATTGKPTSVVNFPA